MIFTSLNFLLIFPFIVILYYALPITFRWKYLLVVSLGFYININPVFAILLVLVALLTYVFALRFDKVNSENRRKNLFYSGITLVLIPLFFFKYYNFVSQSFTSILAYMGAHWKTPEFSLLLPVGISFYTFMAIGYLIDVYNEEIKAENNFGKLCLFLSFFPLVLSGPIERAPNMLPQFKEKLIFNTAKIVQGLRFMLWGYFMKLVIADRLAIYLNQIFDNVDQYSGGVLFLATLLYPIQVYADLGGYSLLAIGAANCFGISIIPNFNRPFFATSMSDFWRRWHMSLINWITDYLYTPISFELRRFKMFGIVMALMITFLIAGIWHGAALTFIFWGALQGVILSIEALTKRRKAALETKFKLNSNFIYITLSIIVTYILFAFSLIFGGAVDSISDSFLVFTKIFNSFGEVAIDFTNLKYAFIGIFLLLFSELFEEFHPKKIKFFNNPNLVIRHLCYYVVILLIFVIGVFETDDFIYFQF